MKRVLYILGGMMWLAVSVCLALGTWHFLSGGAGEPDGIWQYLFGAVSPVSVIWGMIQLAGFGIGAFLAGSIGLLLVLRGMHPPQST
ncbi:MAG TPA: hypothetical protein VF607_05445 [Verrucomicrobiae bacterium]